MTKVARPSLEMKGPEAKVPQDPLQQLLLPGGTRESQAAAKEFEEPVVQGTAEAAEEVHSGSDKWSVEAEAM